VTAALSAAGIGLTLRPGAPPVPIVPGAVLYDLANGGDKSWGTEPPYRALGVQALEAASLDFALGSIGAGRGAMAGLLKGGVGSVSIDLGDGLLAGALVAVNSVGSALMPDGSTYWAWPFELDGEFGAARPSPGAANEDAGNPSPDDTRLRARGRMQLGVNTTLGIVACNAALTNVECRRLAIMAQDGVARALRPAHTPFDGDTIFVIAGARVELDAQTRAAEVGRLGSAAADCVARAIARAVHHAR
jgi:L-aminopeptidase/D-esterase-like protein